MSWERRLEEQVKRVNATGKGVGFCWECKQRALVATRMFQKDGTYRGMRLNCKSCGFVYVTD